MEKTKLDPFISALLYEHDCVIIADFGGFVANYRSAYLHPVHHTLSAPSKKIAFNASLKSNDGLLANHLADVQSISYQEACSKINQYVEESLDLLETGKKLHIDKIGSLFYNPEKKIQFAPDHSTNYLLDSFGFTTVHSPLIRREAFAKRVETRIPEAAPVQLHEVHRKKRVNWRWVELVPAAAVLTLLLLNPLIVRKFNQNLASLVPEVRMETPYNEPLNEEQLLSPVATAVDSSFMTSTPAVDSSAGIATAITNEPAPLTTLHTDEEKPATTNTAETITNTTNESPSMPVQTGSHFYIVAGCFRIEENANQLHEDLVAKGYASEMIGKYKGLHVVTFAQAASFSQAKQEMEKLKGLSLDAWVLRK